MGKLREVREVREKLRDKCPMSYGKRLKVMFRVACARNLGGNLHVKSEDLNSPEIYLR